MKLSVDIHLSKLNQNLNCWFKSKFRLLIFWKIVFSSPSRFIVIQDLHHRDEWVQIYTYLLHLLLQKSSFGDIVPLSGGSRNFITGVRARCDWILGVWGLFWCPFIHTLYIFVVRSSREYDTYYKHCMLTTIKENAYKIHNNTPTPHTKNQARGRGSVLDPSLPLYNWFCRDKI